MLEQEVSELEVVVSTPFFRLFLFIIVCSRRKREILIVFSKFLGGTTIIYIGGPGAGGGGFGGGGAGGAGGAGAGGAGGAGAGGGSGGGGGRGGGGGGNGGKC